VDNDFSSELSDLKPSIAQLLTQGCAMSNLILNQSQTDAVADDDDEPVWGVCGIGAFVKRTTVQTRHLIGSKKKPGPLAPYVDRLGFRTIRSSKGRLRRFNRGLPPI
jgi:hypothetical protein